MVWCLCFALFFSVILADSEPQREYILFERADVDLNGKLDQSEFDLILTKFDRDGDKRVSLTEFVKDWTDIYHLGAPEEATALFDEADSNDDAILEHADLVLFFKYFDMNKDGNVDLNEFLTQWGELKLVPVYIVTSNDTATSASPDGVFG